MASLESTFLFIARELVKREFDTDKLSHVLGHVLINSTPKERSKLRKAWYDEHPDGSGMDIIFDAVTEHLGEDAYEDD